MTYHQITSAERLTLATLRKQHRSCREIAEAMERHRSTIYRELKRNRCSYDEGYRYERADDQARLRRKNSRRNCRLTAEDWRLIEQLIGQDLSPEQISGFLQRHGRLTVSHETIYKRIWWDKRHGGTLYRHLRQRPKFRKRYGTYEKRGRVTGKRHISERPAAVDSRQEIGHWEMDTVVGKGGKHCVVTLVERVTGCVLIGKLRRRTVAALNRRLLEMIRGLPSLFKTITADNGTEFHGFRQIEHLTGTTIYFATPYHSWERGTNENTNGLIRQYIPKTDPMTTLSQAHCDEIATKLNNRPRKRHHFHTPIEVLERHLSRLSLTSVSVAVQS